MTKKRQKILLKRAAALYGRCVLSTVLGFFMWISIGIIATALIPDGEKISVAGNLAMNSIALIIQGFLFGTIICSESWRHGDRDGAKDLFKGRQGDPHFGLKVALVATVPSWIAYFLMLADKAFGLWSGMLSAYRLVNGSLYPLIVWTLGNDLKLTIAQVPWVGAILSVLPILITLAIAWVGYYLGYKQVAVMKRIMYKKDQPGRR